MVKHQIPCIRWVSNWEGLLLCLGCLCYHFFYLKHFLSYDTTAKSFQVDWSYSVPACRVKIPTLLPVLLSPSALLAAGPIYLSQLQSSLLFGIVYIDCFFPPESNF